MLSPSLHLPILLLNATIVPQDLAAVLQGSILRNFQIIGERLERLQDLVLDIENLAVVAHVIGVFIVVVHGVEDVSIKHWSSQILRGLP